MWSKKAIVKVKLKWAFHARPAAMFVQETNKYCSEIFLEKEDVKARAKSVIGVMGMKMAAGEEITILAEGDDAEFAVQALEKMLSSEISELY